MWCAASSSRAAASLSSGKKPEIAGQKQQKRLGAVVGLGLGLVPVQALGSNPGLEVVGQRAKPHHDPLIAADQIMRKEGQREIGLILAAVVFVRPVAANALLDPQREFAPQGHIVRVCLCQFVDHGSKCISYKVSKKSLDAKNELGAGAGKS